MAQSIELILGWPYLEWDRLTDLKLPPYKTGKVRHPGLRIAIAGEEPPPEDEEEEDDDEPMNVHDAFQPTLVVFDTPLKEAHRAALIEMGFKPKKSNKDRYVLAKTPLGEREFVPFKLELFYDPSEMCDDAESAIIGVSISGRYFPTFADWKDPHGTLTPMVFNAELQRVMEIAKRHITGVLPCLADAPWVVKEIHY